MAYGINCFKTFHTVLWMLFIRYEGCYCLLQLLYCTFNSNASEIKSKLDPIPAEV